MGAVLLLSCIVTTAVLSSPAPHSAGAAAALPPGSPAARSPSPASPKRAANDGPVIEVWHGLTQRVGHLGRAQDDFNVLGNVHDPDGVASLTYSLNGAPAVLLTIGNRPDGFGDGRRLAATGDFNADIPLASLTSGLNRVRLVAKDRLGATSTVLVRVRKEEGTAPLPFEIVWRSAGNPQNVGQYVDGQWGKRDGGLRILRPGYDRIFLIGEEAWQDYEVRVPVTIHAVQQATGPYSGWPGLGLLMRFRGHSQGASTADTQPKHDQYPFGAIGWLRWTGGAARPPIREYLRGDTADRVSYGPAAVTVGDTYWLEMRCESLSDAANGDGRTRYSWKLWPDGEQEPAAWDFRIVQRSGAALRRGGVGLLAHHVDATFGDVTVRSLAAPPDKPDEPDPFPLTFQREGTAVLLQWDAPGAATSYAVQHARQTDIQGPFETIAVLTEQASVQAPARYAYRVQDLDAGRHLYRVKQNRPNGTATYSDIVTVDLFVAGSYLLDGAYPNPFNTNTHLRLTVMQTQPVCVDVFDVLGRRVAVLYDGELEAYHAQELVLEANGLPSGPYLIRAAGDAFVATYGVLLLK